MRKRNETPTAFGCKSNATMLKSRQDNRPDRIHNPGLTEHERAIEALAMMKQLEKERKKKMVTVQVDERTVISSTKKRAAQLAAEYLGKK